MEKSLRVLLSVILAVCLIQPVEAKNHKYLLIGDSRLVGMCLYDTRMKDFCVLAQVSGSGKVNISEDGTHWTWLNNRSRVNTLTGDISSSSFNLAYYIKKEHIIDIVYMMGRNSISDSTIDWKPEAKRLTALKKVTGCTMWFGYTIPDKSTHTKVNNNIVKYNKIMAKRVSSKHRINLYTPMLYHDKYSGDGIHYSNYQDAIKVLKGRLK